MYGGVDDEKTQINIRVDTPYLQGGYKSAR
jgi:hypothetical protein